MDDARMYKISFFGEFVDKALEREFIHYDMKRCARFIGPVTLIFGVIYMLFLIFDYFAAKNPFSFTLLLVIRALVLILSVAIYLSIRKIKNYATLIYFITAYEIVAVISFLVIIYQYEYFTYLALFSVIAIILGIYVMPNKLLYEQIISVFLLVSFFILPARHIEGLDTSELLKVIAYHLLILIFCNLWAYMTNYYKRKQFADGKELLRVSITDPLTGIYNRVKFNEELKGWIDSCNKHENFLSLVIFDIDDFKRVNDTYGHLVGDGVIKNIASTVKKSIRNTDIFARWGGEEFVVLLPHTDIRQAVEIAEQMRICIQKSTYEKVKNITCSFGLVTLRKNENAESFIHRADELLYKAKNLGKNAVVCECNEVHTSLFKLHLETAKK